MQTVPVTQIVNPYQRTKFVRHSYASLTSRVLGNLQIIFGFLLMMLQGVAIAIYAGPYFVGHGIWTGILMIIAGAFGLAAANFRSTCTIVASMVLSIIAASFASIPLALSIVGITISHDEDLFDMGRCHYADYGYYPYHFKCPGDYASRVAVNILMLILSLLEITAAIWASVLGCKEMCGTRPHVEGSQQVAMMAIPNQEFQQSTYMVNMPQAQQTTPVFMQQGTPIQNQQAMPVAMQQGTPIQNQQTMPVAMQQGTPIQNQQSKSVAMQQGTSVPNKQTPMVMQQGMPVLVPNGQQFMPTITQQGQQVTPIAMQEAVAQGQQAIPVLLLQGHLANVHSQVANTIGNSPHLSSNRAQNAGAVEQTTECQLAVTGENN